MVCLSLQIDLVSSFACLKKIKTNVLQLNVCFGRLFGLFLVEILNFESWERVLCYWPCCIRSERQFVWRRIVWFLNGDVKKVWRCNFEISNAIACPKWVNHIIKWLWFTNRFRTQSERWKIGRKKKPNVWCISVEFSHQCECAINAVALIVWQVFKIHWIQTQIIDIIKMN